jgi:hypothetical protein
MSIATRAAIRFGFDTKDGATARLAKGSAAETNLARNAIWDAAWRRPMLQRHARESDA